MKKKAIASETADAATPENSYTATAETINVSEPLISSPTVIKIETWVALIHFLMTDRKAFWRSIKIFTSLTFIIVVAVCSIVLVLRVSVPGLEFKVTDTGATIISLANRPKTAWFLLSANGGEGTPWVNTTIPLVAGQRIRIRASGKVTTGIHHIVVAANDDNDPRPFSPWAGPNGLRRDSALPPRTHRAQDLLSERFLISPSHAKGMLIGTIEPSTAGPKNQPDKILAIGEEGEFEVTSAGTLWLTINEVWLERSKPEVYAVSKKECGKSKGVDAFTTNILDKDYYNLWYDDNAGSFLVTIEFLH